MAHWNNREIVGIPNFLVIHLAFLAQVEKTANRNALLVNLRCGYQCGMQVMIAGHKCHNDVTKESSWLIRRLDWDRTRNGRQQKGERKRGAVPPPPSSAWLTDGRRDIDCGRHSYNVSPSRSLTFAGGLDAILYRSDSTGEQTWYNVQSRVNCSS